ncbi:hypothetical protein Tco_1332948, partial [Tanacetum coccineum]
MMTASDFSTLLVNYFVIGSGTRADLQAEVDQIDGELRITVNHEIKDLQKVYDDWLEEDAKLLTLQRYFIALEFQEANEAKDAAYSNMSKAMLTIEKTDYEKRILEDEVIKLNKTLSMDEYMNLKDSSIDSVFIFSFIRLLKFKSNEISLERDGVAIFETPSSSLGGSSNLTADPDAVSMIQTVSYLSPDVVRIIQTTSLESGLESSSIFTPVSYLVYSDVMLIELVKDDEYPINDELNKNEGEGEEEFKGNHFDKFPTCSELAYHKYLMHDLYLSEI